MKAYYLTGICTGAVNTGECNTPDLNGARVLHGKNLLKVPHGKKKWPGKFLHNPWVLPHFFKNLPPNRKE